MRFDGIIPQHRSVIISFNTTSMDPRKLEEFVEKMAQHLVDEARKHVVTLGYECKTDGSWTMQTGPKSFALVDAK